ncbi:hypothetical protein [uncultured Mediterranean phage uvMED]|nr:hypothetical protein [uncultured Mediterranean phage uvMED]BAR19730.1 hypothetical protein [uncultured Mediterranean phage uvMED]BAR19775.1 hypothetical protein [uncultured Mediterranean phage uvMED]
MPFQANGTTLIDSARAFQAAAFGKTVNGQNVVGTGDMKYIRPTTYGGVGTFTIQCCSTSTGSNNLNAGTTAAGSTLMVLVISGRHYSFDTTIGHNTSDLTAYAQSGTWRSISHQAYDTNSGKHMNILWARTA